MAIPYASPSFDSVVSCLGVMFERHHQTVAKEQLRMTTPRGHAVVDLARDHMTRRGLMQWEYLLLTAHRAG